MGSENRTVFGCGCSVLAYRPASGPWIPRGRVRSVHLLDVVRKGWVALRVGTDVEEIASRTAFTWEHSQLRNGRAVKNRLGCRQGKACAELTWHVTLSAKHHWQPGVAEPNTSFEEERLSMNRLMARLLVAMPLVRSAEEAMARTFPPAQENPL